MSVTSKFNCPYCARPIAINYSAAFPPQEQTNGDEVDPPVPGGYRGDIQPSSGMGPLAECVNVKPDGLLTTQLKQSLTKIELERRARAAGADPDRVDYSGCSDYRPEDNRLEQTGQGWAEPPDDISIPSPFDIARDICKNWLGDRDLTYALKDIDERERRATATEGNQTAR